MKEFINMRKEEKRKSQTHHQRYFIALVPPKTIFTEVMKLKEEVRDSYASKEALRSPPHITLHMPFKYKEDREEQIISLLAGFAKSQRPFHLSHDGFGAFEPRVIFVKVTLPDELAEMRQGLVKRMRSELKLDNSDYKNHGFLPHMTIAFRDLKKPMFYEAWEKYQSQPFLHEWSCDSMCLLKHDGREWQQHRVFTFGM